MKLASLTLPAIAVLLGAMLGGCSTNGDATENESHPTRESRGEHDHDGGEESGTEMALSERYDSTRNGVRLTLSHDADSNTFQGTVENTTSRNLERVRVEVHLSNGKELGPTTPADLAPGEKRNITLTATSSDFDRWTAHPEVGSGEHGGEHGGEHDREGDSEHGGEHD